MVRRVACSRRCRFVPQGEGEAGLAPTAGGAGGGVVSVSSRWFPRPSVSFPVARRALHAAPLRQVRDGRPALGCRGGARFHLLPLSRSEMAGWRAAGVGAGGMAETASDVKRMAGRAC